MKSIWLHRFMSFHVPSSHIYIIHIWFWFKLSTLTCSHSSADWLLSDVLPSLSLWPETLQTCTITSLWHQNSEHTCRNLKHCDPSGSSLRLSYSFQNIPATNATIFWILFWNFFEVKETFPDLLHLIDGDLSTVDSVHTAAKDSVLQTSTQTVEPQRNSPFC